MIRVGKIESNYIEVRANFHKVKIQQKGGSSAREPSAEESQRSVGSGGFASTSVIKMNNSAQLPQWHQSRYLHF